MSAVFTCFRNHLEAAIKVAVNSQEPEIIPEETVHFHFDEYGEIAVDNEELQEAMETATEEFEWGDVQISAMYDIEVGPEIVNYMTVRGTIENGQIATIQIDLTCTDEAFLEYLQKSGASHLKDLNDPDPEEDDDDKENEQPQSKKPRVVIDLTDE